MAVMRGAVADQIARASGLFHASATRSGARDRSSVLRPTIARALFAHLMRSAIEASWASIDFAFARTCVGKTCGRVAAAAKTSSYGSRSVQYAVSAAKTPARQAPATSSCWNTSAGLKGSSIMRLTWRTARGMQSIDCKQCCDRCSGACETLRRSSPSSPFPARCPAATAAEPGGTAHGARPGAGGLDAVHPGAGPFSPRRKHGLRVCA